MATINLRQRRALAEAITQVENRTSEATGLVQSAFLKGGKAHIVGITGPPGAGKSTLVGRLAAAFRSRGHTVAIIAVDPSSPFSGGAVLGDRLRMQSLLSDPGIFMRSLSNRGHLGGLSKATRDVVTLLDAAGFDIVLVETVGVGQSEVGIMSVAHTVLVVQVPGLGDEIQAIKAGVLEIAHIFVVNKADLDGAEQTAHDIRTVIRLYKDRQPGANQSRRVEGPAAEAGEAADWIPPVVCTAAEGGEGIDQLIEQILAHQAYFVKTNQLADYESLQAEALIRERVIAEVTNKVLQHSEKTGEMAKLIQAVAARRMDPDTAAAQIWGHYLKV